jgi:rare lipoprotein A
MTDVRWVRWTALAPLLFSLTGCAARARPSRPAAGPPTVLERREGLASYYGRQFEGKATASGIRFEMHAMVAAHPRYPFGTVVRVTSLATGRSVEVRVVDRGPSRRVRREGVIIDLSRAAAQAIGAIHDGRTPIRLEVLRWGT